MVATVAVSYIRLCTSGHLTNELSEDAPSFFSVSERMEQLTKEWIKSCKYCSSLEGFVFYMSKDQLGEPLKFEEIKISGRSKKVPVFDLKTRLEARLEMDSIYQEIMHEIVGLRSRALVF